MGGRERNACIKDKEGLALTLASVSGMLLVSVAMADAGLAARTEWRIAADRSSSGFFVGYA